MIVEVLTKYCSCCRLVLAISEFNRNRSQKDGLQNWCRNCFKKREDLYRETRRAYRNKLIKERYASEEGYRKHINRYFKSTYGITFEDFETMTASQDNRCAICGDSPSEESRLYVDHCHKEGKIRGLLCFHCNTGLGHFRDNPSLLESAIRYLYDK